MILSKVNAKKRLWLRGVALLLCAALLLSMAACVAEPEPAGLSLNYRIAKGAGRHTLRVWLTIDNAVKDETLRLYLSGNDFEVKKVTDAREQPCTYTKQDDYLDVTAPGDELTVYYTVAVGAPGKHGRAGFSDDTLWTASGEQLLLMPLAAYSVDENEVSEAVDSVSIQVEAEEDRLISAPTGRWNEVTWNRLYQLRQSAFAVGKFRQETWKIGGAIVHIDYATDEQASVLTDLRSMLDYYAGLFGQVPNGLRICLLDTTGGGEYVMGGAGGHAMAATFLPENERDWELLAHRLFHAFFEEKYPYYAAHMPGNLWFYEGLASCYEWLATGYALDERENAADGPAKLYAQYLYLFAKYPALRLQAAEEAVVTEESAAKTEFLHYYIAPLLVYPLLSAETKSGETVERFASWLSTATLEDDQVVVEQLGTISAGDAVLKAAQSKQVISQPEGMTLSVSEDELVSLLADAEEHLASWMRLEDAAFTYDPIDAPWLDMAMRVAEKRGTPCSDDPLLSQIISEFSPALSRILAATALQKEIEPTFPDSGKDRSVEWYSWLQRQLKQ